jgi:hypothetical protein
LTTHSPSIVLVFMDRKMSPSPLFHRYFSHTPARVLEEKNSVIVCIRVAQTTTIRRRQKIAFLYLFFFLFFFKELYRHPTLSDAALLMICTRTCFFRIVISFMFALFPFLLFVSLIHARRGGKQNAGGDRFPLRRAELMCRVNCWIQLNSTRLHPLRVPPRASAWKSKPGE